ncbi:MAG: hypothetical protein HC932_02420 [Thermales bacterium]|nr:hypothetical protein [Thermales bacterium]
MWLFKYELEMSYPAIGKVFGGRNHTTVMHAINKVDSLTKKDTKLKQKINHIKIHFQKRLSPLPKKLIN